MGAFLRLNIPYRNIVLCARILIDALIFSIAFAFAFAFGIPRAVIFRIVVCSSRLVVQDLHRVPVKGQ